MKNNKIKFKKMLIKIHTHLTWLLSRVFLFQRQTRISVLASIYLTNSSVHYEGKSSFATPIQNVY